MADKKESSGVAAADPAVQKVDRAPQHACMGKLKTEADRLKEDKSREKNWKRWGPYLSERQWATVREDYSPDGSWYVCIK